METQNQNWQAVSEIELIYRTKIKASQRPQIKSSREAYKLILSTWDFNKIELLEQFKVVFLSQANRALGIIELSSGGISGTIVDVRLVFSAALKAKASAIMIVHNHPSGQLIASELDRKITQKVKEAGKLLDIALLDSLIITPESYYSFADEGFL